MLNILTNNCVLKGIIGESAMFERPMLTEIVDFSEYSIKNLDKTAENVVKLLEQKQQTIATAER